jgi:hypothetical protein
MFHMFVVRSVSDLAHRPSDDDDAMWDEPDAIIKHRDDNQRLSVALGL